MFLWPYQVEGDKLLPVHCLGFPFYLQILCISKVHICSSCQHVTLQHGWTVSSSRSFILKIFNNSYIFSLIRSLCQKFICNIFIFRILSVLWHIWCLHVLYKNIDYITSHLLGTSYQLNQTSQPSLLSPELQFPYIGSVVDKCLGFD